MDEQAKAFICWGCHREYDVDHEICPECGAEIWTWEEIQGWQGIGDDSDDDEYMPFGGFEPDEDEGLDAEYAPYREQWEGGADDDPRPRIAPTDEQLIMDAGMRDILHRAYYDLDESEDGDGE